MPSIAPLTLLLFFGGWLLLWLPIAIPLSRRLDWHPWQVATPQQKIPLVLSLYLLAPVILWGACWMTGRSLIDYGIHWDWMSVAKLGFGGTIALAGCAILFGIETIAGWVQWQSVPLKSWLGAASGVLVLALFISAVEEAVFRGFLLTELTAGYGSVIAAIVSSVVFAGLHLVWERKLTLPQIPGLCLMGLTLVLARWLDPGGLALACGLHAGWVWAIATLDTTQLVQPTQTGPAWLVGIEHQPLAGMLGIGLIGCTGLGLAIALPGWH